VVGHQIQFQGLEGSALQSKGNSTLNFRRRDPPRKVWTYSAPAIGHAMRDHTTKETLKIIAGAICALVIVGWLAVLWVPILVTAY